MRVDEEEQRETLRAYDFARLAGGKAANRALLACNLGHETQLIGMVGDDDFAGEALTSLRSVGRRRRLSGRHRARRLNGSLLHRRTTERQEAHHARGQCKRGLECDAARCGDPRA
ncbi:PfkB family carbohydrate kinase [Caballeronia sp. S22]|uniref:PfkB family carbohydrate kinase n=1 Tax=Caballeronia sp. S22 TaxID=3137182 RepID=UPI0035306091